MSLDHAKKELELIGAFDPQKDFYGGMTGKATMELMECFSRQGHSGMSASLVVGLFSDLVDGKPLSHLKFSADEWVEVGENVFQNKRCSAVFKNPERFDGKPYFIDAIVWREKGSSSFTGHVNGYTSAQPFGKTPYPKTFYVEVDKDRNIVDHVELEKALEYYS